MLKYYISVFAIGVFVFILIVTGIIIAGSPISQKDIQLDKIRTQSFDQIKNQIESYYKANRKLPSSLNEIKILNIKDPITKNNYDYKVEPPYGYQLCTTFSTDNSEIVDRAGYSNYESDSATYKKHKKGYDCLTFKLSDYVIKSQIKVSPTPFKNAIKSTLMVNSIPAGIVMTSNIISNTSENGNRTNYVTTVSGIINATIDAPDSVVIDGINYVFNVWSGCNVDIVINSSCSVFINGTTASITATYIVSQS